MLNQKMDRSENIETTYSKTKTELDKKLSIQGYSILIEEYNKESFGSRFCVWTNQEDKFAIRLIWDGRDSRFILEESPYTTTNGQFAWADVAIIPFNSSKFEESYSTEIAKAIAQELKND